MAAERVQKILAQAGFGSRRKCEELIEAGRVLVNGQKAVLGSKADPTVDKILVDGTPLPKAEQFVYIALNKPRKVLTAVTTPDSRRTVREYVNVPERVYPVGRLDYDSEGLVLLTNDGNLTNRLTHPRYGHEKEYEVLVARHPDDEQMEAWRRGVVLEDGYRTQPAQVYRIRESGKGMWLRVILKEGRKRQIRETCERIGLPIVSLIRKRIGNVKLGGLKEGEWRYLTTEEVEGLKGKPQPPMGFVKKKPTPLTKKARSEKPGGQQPDKTVYRQVNNQNPNRTKRTPKKLR